MSQSQLHRSIMFQKTLWNCALFVLIVPCWPGFRLECLCSTFSEDEPCCLSSVPVIRSCAEGVAPPAHLMSGLRLLRCQDLVSITCLLFYLAFIASLVGVQAQDEERSGSLFGGLFAGGERSLGRWHHRRGQQASDGRGRPGDESRRPCWVQLAQHQPGVGLSLRSSVWFWLCLFLTAPHLPLTLPQ